MNARSTTGHRAHPPGSPAIRRESGLALLWTAILGVMIMGAWALAYRATHDTFRAEGFSVKREQRTESVTHCLSTAAQVLETGKPPSDPYTCAYTVVVGGTTYPCHVTYKSVALNTWGIDVFVTTTEELAGLPPLPASFAP